MGRGGETNLNTFNCFARWCSTKRTSPWSHWNVTCSLHDIAETLLTRRYTAITHSLSRVVVPATLTTTLDREWAITHSLSLHTIKRGGVIKKICMDNYVSECIIVVKYEVNKFISQYCCWRNKERELLSSKPILGKLPNVDVKDSLLLISIQASLKRGEGGACRERVILRFKFY